MPLLDVSLVTRSLVTLLDEHVTASPVWPGGQTLTVTPQPPDQLAGDNVLGLYLYHMSEDPHLRTMPPRGQDATPVRLSPMGLNLHYLLTAHSDLDDADGPYREQLMLGLAAKALHDHPRIDDGTTVDGVTVLHAGLQGDDNVFELLLQPLPPEQAVDYWTAGSSPLRLALYYQVSVVLLEPETVQRRAGRVLSYGVYTFTGYTPRLDSSFNVLLVAVPGEADPREIEIRPAQAPYSGAGSPSRVTFLGSSLSGFETALLLRHPQWTDPVEADAAWNVTATDRRVTAEVQETVGGQDVLPGVYDARVRVRVQREAPDGSLRTFDFLSNTCPFTVTPRIDALTVPDAQGVFTATGHVFQHADLGPEAVEVYAGPDRLAVGTVGSLSPGEFAVVDAATLEIRLPGTAASGEQVPVRIVVAGAEAPPQWAEAP
jgi:hypothetical protein